MFCSQGSTRRTGLLLYPELSGAAIQASDTSKVSEIAAYMNQNPSLRIGIDGSMDPRGTCGDSMKINPKDNRIDDLETNTSHSVLS